MAETEPADHEAIYDDLIAPKLLEVAAICREHDIPFLAEVWFRGDDSGRTQVFPPEGVDHPAFTLAHAAVRCKGNFDKLAFALARHVPAEKNGSIVLRMLQKGEG